jgi:hypothetical protein
MFSEGKFYRSQSYCFCFVKFSSRILLHRFVPLKAAKAPSLLTVLLPIVIRVLLERSPGIPKYIPERKEGPFMMHAISDQLVQGTKSDSVNTGEQGINSARLLEDAMRFTTIACKSFVYQGILSPVTSAAQILNHTFVDINMNSKIEQTSDSQPATNAFTTQVIDKAKSAVPMSDPSQAVARNVVGDLQIVEHEGELLGEGIVSGTALESINGMTQLIGHFARTDIKSLEFENQAAVDSSIAGRVGEGLGEAAGTALLAIGVGKALIGGKYGERLMDQSALGSAATFAIASGVQNAFFRPSDPKNFLVGRVDNVVTGSAGGFVGGFIGHATAYAAEKFATKGISSGLSDLRAELSPLRSVPEGGGGGSAYFIQLEKPALVNKNDINLATSSILANQRNNTVDERIQFKPQKIRS